MGKVQITTSGIKKTLRKYNYRRAIAEYVWNGFDANATEVGINVDSNEIGTISKLTIVDDGYGIPYGDLQIKFMPFFESEKEIDPDAHRKTSAIHGKNGVGRLTFFHFATTAKWDTTYEENGQKYTYSIKIDRENLDSYTSSKPIITDLETGTTVTFEGIYEIIASNFESDIESYLFREFGWFLELNKARSFLFEVNGQPLNYAKIIDDGEDFSFQINEYRFDIRYIRWNTSINKEYSRYYYVDSKDNEVEKETTTLNNKSDNFYHSVFIKSSYFDMFTPKKVKNQSSLIGNAKSDKTFKNLIQAVNHFLRSKRKPFLRQFAAQVVDDFEKDNAFPRFSDNSWDVYRKDELENLVREIAQIEPKVFSRLNTEQKKTFAHLLNLIIDIGEQDKLFDILDEIVNLESAEREELASILKSARLSSIIKTIKLIEDRYEVINKLRDLVFKKELRANERDHVQQAIEKHYWIFGEQYHLVTAEEPKFEEALRRYLYILQKVDEKIVIDHPDKYKEMDIFMVRQNMKEDTIHNVVVELKHPNIGLGDWEVSQVKRYMRVILKQDEFNGSNRLWEFYLVGNKFNTSGFIEGELNNARHHGERSLIFRNDRYKIYVKTWDELFVEFELKHKFLNDKLHFEREALISKNNDADDIVASLANNSAQQPPEFMIPSKKPRLLSKV